MGKGGVYKNYFSFTPYENTLLWHEATNRTFLSTENRYSKAYSKFNANKNSNLVKVTPEELGFWQS